MAILVWLLPARLWRASLVRPCLAPAPFPEELPCQGAPRSAAAILAGCFESDKQISSCRKTFGCAPKGGKRGLPVLPTLERARGRAVERPHFWHHHRERKNRQGHAHGKSWLQYSIEWFPK